MTKEEAKQKYFELVKNTLDRTLNEEVYYENHHILPKSLFPQQANNPKNIVPLTFREHLLAHYYLCFIFPCDKMYFAFGSMTDNPKAKEITLDEEVLSNFEELRKNRFEIFKNEEYRKKHSEGLKRFYSNPENRKKVSERVKQYYIDNPSLREKMSKLTTGKNNPMFGKHHTDEVKNARAKAVIGKNLETGEETKFASTREAERQTGIFHSNISQCCKGNTAYSTVGGYIWRYA